MKRQNSVVTHFIATAIFIVAGLACNSSSETKPPAPTNTGNGGSTSTTNSAVTAPAPAKDIAGNYEVSGTNINGQGGYKGGLTITKRGEVYQFSWNTGDAKYDGVGVQTENSVAVSYAAGTDGKGCGVALYKINSDGSLDGKSGYWGNDKSESEKAIRTAGTDLAGDYDVTGKNPDDKEYKAKLNILPSGPGFIFKWTGDNSFDGIGVRQGNFVTAGFGGKQCSFVAYEIKSDGSLDGKWGGLGTVTFGSEKAIKK